jgi:hypothetical protein
VAKASAVMTIASPVANVFALILKINFAILNAALSKLRGEKKCHLYPPLIFPVIVKDLGHLGKCNTNRNDYVCIALPKVAKASAVMTLVSPVSNVFALILTKNFAIINAALSK